MSVFNARSLNLPRELRLLLACCRTSMDQEDGQLVKILCHGPIHWGTFIKLVEHHRLSAMVYRSMRRVADNGVPQYVHRSLRERFEKNTRKVLGLTAELVRLMELLERNSIHALPMKGPALALQIYGELGLRYAGDLDLLVAPEQVGQAGKLLEQEGYRRVNPDFALSPRQKRVYVRRRNDFGYYHHVRQIRVELHFRWCPDSYMFPLNINHVWKQRLFVSVAGRHLKTLPFEETLFFLCAHGAKHAWSRLFWLCDVAELLRTDHTIDWTKQMASAAGLGVLRPLAQGLLLSHLLLASPLPDPVRIFSERDSAVQGLVKMALRIIAEPTSLSERPFTRAYILKKLHYFRMQMGLRNKLLVCLKQINTIPNDWCTVPLPDALFPLYYVLRPFMWFWRRYLKGMTNKRFVGSIVGAKSRGTG